MITLLAQLTNIATVASPAPLFPTIVTDVPGRLASDHFIAEIARLPPAGQPATTFEPLYVFQSTAKIANEKSAPTNGYFSHLNNWTVSWVSSQIEVAEGLLLRVKRANGGAPIKAAAVHPRSAGVHVLSVGTEWVTLSTSSLSTRVAVDFDGAMDETDTGPSYKGPPLHTFCWFVDAAMSASDLPDPTASDVIIVRPGDDLAKVNASKLSATVWQTVVFAPGVHRAATPGKAKRTVLWQAPLTRYFFCAGSVVHAAFAAGANAGSKWGAKGFVMDGFGILTGEDMIRPAGDNTSPQGITWDGVVNSSLLGVTVVDFPNHHLILGGGSDDFNEIHGVKVLGWRANGDGLHVFKNWHVSDLFMRTQDDSMYLDSGGGGATTFDRVTTWNDANGCAFIYSAGGGDTSTNILRDSTAIYARASWAWWSGGRIFGLRHTSTGKVMSGVTVDRLVVEDRLPSLNAWEFDATCNGGAGSCKNAGFVNLSFTNVHIANWSTVRSHGQTLLPKGVPNIMLTDLGAMMNNVSVNRIRFTNCTIGGVDLAATFKDGHSWNISKGRSVHDITVDGKPVEV